jgi:hypothetical protein
MTSVIMLCQCGYPESHYTMRRNAYGVVAPFRVQCLLKLKPKHKINLSDFLLFFQFAANVFVAPQHYAKRHSAY